MRRKTVVVGLDGIVWNDSLCRKTYVRLERAGFVEPQNRKLNPSKPVALEAISKAVAGHSVRHIDPIVYEVSKNFGRRADATLIRRLGELSRKRHQIIAMSSAPDFIVKAALDQLRGQGLSFSNSLTLTSPFEVVTGQFTGNYDQLDKTWAIEQVVEVTGSPIALGFINGMSDAAWVTRYCETIEPVNPGPALQRALVENQALASKVS